MTLISEFKLPSPMQGGSLVDVGEWARGLYEIAKVAAPLPTMVAWRYRIHERYLHGIPVPPSDMAGPIFVRGGCDCFQAGGAGGCLF